MGLELGFAQLLEAARAGGHRPVAKDVPEESFQEAHYRMVPSQFMWALLQ